MDWVLPYSHNASRLWKNSVGCSNLWGLITLSSTPGSINWVVNILSKREQNDDTNDNNDEFCDDLDANLSSISSTHLAILEAIKEERDNDNYYKGM